MTNNMAYAALSTAHLQNICLGVYIRQFTTYVSASSRPWIPPPDLCGLIADLGNPREIQIFFLLANYSEVSTRMPPEFSEVSLGRTDPGRSWKGGGGSGGGGQPDAEKQISVSLGKEGLVPQTPFAKPM